MRNSSKGRSVYGSDSRKRFFHWRHHGCFRRIFRVLWIHDLYYASSSCVLPLLALTLSMMSDHEGHKRTFPGLPHFSRLLSRTQGGHRRMFQGSLFVILPDLLLDKLCGAGSPRAWAWRDEEGRCFFVTELNRSTTWTEDQPAKSLHRRLWN